MTEKRLGVRLKNNEIAALTFYCGRPSQYAAIVSLGFIKRHEGPHPYYAATAAGVRWMADGQEGAWLADLSPARSADG